MLFYEPEPVVRQQARWSKASSMAAAAPAPIPKPKRFPALVPPPTENEDNEDSATNCVICRKEVTKKNGRVCSGKSCPEMFHYKCVQTNKDPRRPAFHDKKKCKYTHHLIRARGAEMPTSIRKKYDTHKKSRGELEYFRVDECNNDDYRKDIIRGYCVWKKVPGRSLLKVNWSNLTGKGDRIPDEFVAPWHRWLLSVLCSGSVTEYLLKTIPLLPKDIKTIPIDMSSPPALDEESSNVLKDYEEIVHYECVQRMLQDPGLTAAQALAIVCDDINSKLQRLAHMK